MAEREQAGTGERANEGTGTQGDSKSVAPTSPLPGPATRLVLLLGDPVAHSRSPALHNAAFRALGLDAVYLACRVEAARLGDAVAGLRALGALGANVTIPHKEAVVPLVDRLTPTASAVGAVNTLVVEPGGALLGDNTDVEGFLRPLMPYADRLKDAEITILGAGGGARAAVYALLTAHAPRRITVAARRVGRARRLTADLAAHDPGRVLRAIPLDSLPRTRSGGAGAALRASALVINATPVGMAPRVDATPWPHPADFHAGQLVYDLVYAPAETRLLREAAAQGATPLGGPAMLVGQAAAAFERWTGRPMPLDAARAALQP